jgi:beta-lactamase regulating signal transducer with metallopeptidase domain
MALGTSLFLIAVGAILRYAISDSLEGIDIPTIGLILMIVGIVGFVIAVVYEAVAMKERSRWYRASGDRGAAVDPNAPTRRYE